MSTNKKITSRKHKEVDFEKEVMSRVTAGEIVMKPKWYFVLGSTLIALGFVLLTAGAVFLTNLTVFLIRKRGPGIGRLNFMLDSFPLWIPLLAALGIILGLWFLKKYDFSYKKNFGLIVVGFIISVAFAAFLLDYSGLNDAWSYRGPMRGLYQQIEKQNTIPQNRQRQGWKQR